MSELNKFINPNQLAAMRELCNGEEGEFYRDTMRGLEILIAAMPVTYETDGQGDDAVIYLHYFHPKGFDWYITERDVETEQMQAFGLAVLHEPELGYISIKELLSIGAELDLHFTAKTVGQIKAEFNNKE